MYATTCPTTVGLATILAIPSLNIYNKYIDHYSVFKCDALADSFSQTSKQKSVAISEMCRVKQGSRGPRAQLACCLLISMKALSLRTVMSRSE